MYNQLSTPAEAAEIARKLGLLGGGVIRTYVPEYGGPFAPPESGDSKFLHFDFANGASGFNVGLVRAFMDYAPFQWPTMIASELAAARKYDVPEGGPVFETGAPVPVADFADSPVDFAAKLPDGRFNDTPFGASQPVGTKWRDKDGVVWHKTGPKSFLGPTGWEKVS